MVPFIPVEQTAGIGTFFVTVGIGLAVSLVLALSFAAFRNSNHLRRGLAIFAVGASASLVAGGFAVGAPAALAVADQERRACEALSVTYGIDLGAPDPDSFLGETACAGLDFPTTRPDSRFQVFGSVAVNGRTVHLVWDGDAFHLASRDGETFEFLPAL